MLGVSVVIPAYNHARYIAQALDSVLAQTYPAQEIIVVDDGSTDNTSSVVGAYRDRVHYIYQPNRGPSSARNAGVNASHGDCLLFLDADDLIPSNKLELQATALEARSEVGLVYSAWQYVDEGGKRILAEVHPHQEGNLLLAMLRRAFFFPVAAALVRRECVERVGGWDESLRASEDTDLWIRIARAGFSFGYLDYPLFKYRIVPSGASHNIAHQVTNEFSRLDKFFSDPTLPEAVRALEHEVRGILHFESAARYFKAGNNAQARQHIGAAVNECPCLASNQDWFLDWAAAVALEPDVQDPARLLGDLFSHLPPEAEVLHSLQRRVLGRYHTAAAFAAYQCHHSHDVRQHILPALLNDPAVICNRGFISISLRSLVANRQAAGDDVNRANQ